MSNPWTIRSSRAAGHLDKRMAAGIASLYDEVDQSTLQPPIYSYGSMEVMPPNNMIDLCTPDAAVASRSHVTVVGTPVDLTSTEELAEDRMDMDRSAGESDVVKVNKARSEWVGTSQFFIEQNIEWQQNVRDLPVLSSRNANNFKGTTRFAYPIPTSNPARFVPKPLRSYHIHRSESNPLQNWFHGYWRSNRLPSRPSHRRLPQPRP